MQPIAVPNDPLPRNSIISYLYAIWSPIIIL